MAECRYQESSLEVPIMLVQGTKRAALRMKVMAIYMWGAG